MKNQRPRIMLALAAIGGAGAVSAVINNLISRNKDRANRGNEKRAPRSPPPELVLLLQLLCFAFEILCQFQTTFALVRVPNFGKRPVPLG